MKSVSVNQVQDMLSNGDPAIVLDVRTEEEFASETGFIPGAVLIPLQELEERAGELEQYRGKPLVVYCRTQSRSAAAARFLAGRGFDTVYMTGGIIGWNRAGHRVDRAERR